MRKESQRNEENEKGKKNKNRENSFGGDVTIFQSSDFTINDSGTRGFTRETEEGRGKKTASIHSLYREIFDIIKISSLFTVSFLLV